MLAYARESLSDLKALYELLPDAERRLMTLTILGKLLVDNEEISGHQLNQPFGDLVNVELRRRSGSGKSYGGTIARLNSHWVAMFDDITAHLQEDALVIESVFDRDLLANTDL